MLLHIHSQAMLHRGTLQHLCVKAQKERRSGLLGWLHSRVLLSSTRTLARCAIAAAGAWCAPVAAAQRHCPHTMQAAHTSCSQRRILHVKLLGACAGLALVAGLANVCGSKDALACRVAHREYTAKSTEQPSRLQTKPCMTGHWDLGSRKRDSTHKTRVLWNPISHIALHRIRMLGMEALYMHRSLA
jgi:hypothetical protein